MSRKIFSVFENELLLELVKNRLDVIECKETNKVSLDKKNEAFEQIEKQFNSSLHVIPRTASQLRQKYNNLKKSASSKCAELRKEVRKTGGGSISSKNVSEMEERVLEMGILTTPLRTAYDSDASYLDFVSSQEVLPTPEENYSSQSHPIEDSQEILPDVIEPNLVSVREENNSQGVFLATPINSTVNPSKRPRALDLFRRKVKSKTPPVSASAKAAQALIAESESRTANEKRKAEREEIEHNKRMDLLNKKVELKQKKIDVQQKILDILDTNPGSLTLSFK